MNYFTEWRRSMDGPELALVTTRENGSIVEWIDLDIRELPDRPELLGRLSPIARERLLAEGERLLFQERRALRRLPLKRS